MIVNPGSGPRSIHINRGELTGPGIRAKPIYRLLSVLGLACWLALVPLPTGAAACVVAVLLLLVLLLIWRLVTYYLSLLLGQREHAPTLSTGEGWVSVIRFTPSPNASTVNREDHRFVPIALLFSQPNLCLQL